MSDTPNTPDRISSALELAAAHAGRPLTLEECRACRTAT